MSISVSTQDYVKAIWKLHEWHQGESDERCVISPTDLAHETGMRASTVSGALSRLTDQGFVMHAPYGGIELTEKGKDLALTMLRRHRIIETYLVYALSYSWDEVHDEAESLEHAASTTMIERMEERLGFPDRDPHGDPIPDRNGNIPHFDTINLNLVPVGERAIIARVNDDNNQLLQTLENNHAMIDSVITVQSICADSITLQAEGGVPFKISTSDADFIRVSRLS
ncbi:metal-dependent transcriptional regulator [Alloscardovia omnicolens]|uniref:metal-dependent transcriptional regulator n=1 Tax=Alloscardovia omnicolens TaxID=419015 RepID=UPI003A6E583C